MVVADSMAIHPIVKIFKSQLEMSMLHAAVGGKGRCSSKLSGFYTLESKEDMTMH